MFKIYTLFVALVLAFVAYAYSASWGFGDDADEVRNVPGSVRDNPGVFRSHYIYTGHYSGGK